MRLPVSFTTLGDRITIEERELESLGCFDTATGTISLRPDMHPVGKLVTLIHEALHVGEVSLKHEIDHDFLTSAAFGVAVILIEAGAINSVTPGDIRDFLQEQADADAAVLRERAIATGEPAFLGTPIFDDEDSQ